MNTHKHHTQKLLTVLKPFRYHHNLLQRGKHDEDVVERVCHIKHVSLHFYSNMTKHERLGIIL